MGSPSIYRKNDPPLTRPPAALCQSAKREVALAPVGELRRVITEVHKGGCVIDPQLSRYVLKAMGTGNEEAENENESPLSKRERQVLELMAMGYAKKEVADELDISYSAVATAIRKGLI